MSVTFGFYNSKEGDRRYDAIQMSSIFDGIIQDGILQHVGTAMVVKESEAQFTFFKLRHLEMGKVFLFFILFFTLFPVLVFIIPCYCLRRCGASKGRD